MPLVPYNASSSLSRYSPEKNWSKILFRPDRKLQTTEIEEIQDLLLSQVNRAFDTLYDFYTVISGCKVLVLGITSTGYSCILTEGQVYVDFQSVVGTYVDTNVKAFTAPRDEKTTVGVRFFLQLDVDNPTSGNPHNGGAAFGSLGADRLILRSEIVIDNISNPQTKDYYPIAIILPKSPGFVTATNDLSDGAPDIYYYRNEELTTTFNERTISTDMKRIVETTFHEMAGDFISEGYEVSFNERNLVIHVNPGIAYIKGRRVEHHYINSYELFFDPVGGPTEYEDLIYLVWLNKLGEFGVEVIPADSIYTPEPPAEAIALGMLRWHGYADQRGEPSYELIPSKLRMPRVADIISIEKAHEKNKQELLDLALNIDLVTAGNSANTQLNGLVADSFNDLNKTDIFNPLFRASVLPSIQAISLPFISFPKDNRAFILPTADNSNIQAATKLDENGVERFYWSTVSGNDVVVIEQPRVTNFGSDTNQSFFLPTFVASSGTQQVSSFASPNLVYKSDRGTLVNYTDPKILQFAKVDVTGQVNGGFQNDVITIDTPGNNNLIQTQLIIVEASGFPSYLNNILITLNDAVLSDVTFLENQGTAGSNFGTARASVSGRLKFSFTLPAVNQRDTFSLRMSSGVYVSTIDIKVEDPEFNRLRRELSGRYVLPCPIRYSLTASGLAQTFLLDTPTMVKAIDLVVNINNILSVFNELPNPDVLSVYLTKTQNGRPTDEVLGVGTLYYNSIDLTNITAWVRVNFDRPILLKETSSFYAIVIQSGVSNIEIGTAVVQEIDNNSGFAGSNLLAGARFLTKSNASQWEFDNTRLLSFRLVSHKPNSTLTNTFITVRNTESYNMLDFNLPVELSDGGQVQVAVQNQRGTYDVLQNGVYVYPDEVTESTVRITTVGNANTHPILDLDDMNLNLISSRTSGTWTSINYEFETGYNSIEISYEAFNPANASFTVFISSNKGTTWEEITELATDGSEENLVSVETVNALIPTSKYTYVKELTKFVQLNGQDVERKNLILRVDMDISDKTNIPFFKNFVALTY